MRNGSRRDWPKTGTPVEGVSGITLRSIVPAHEDWICLRVIYDSPQSPRLFLHRVAVWALAGGPDTVDHIVGIGESGLPPEKEGSDVYYVHGNDLSPNGETWSAVYGSVVATLHQVREVTHLFPDLV